MAVTLHLGLPLTRNIWTIYQDENACRPITSEDQRPDSEANKCRKKKITIADSQGTVPSPSTQKNSACVIQMFKIADLKGWYYQAGSCSTRKLDPQSFKKQL